MLPNHKFCQVNFGKLLEMAVDRCLIFSLGRAIIKLGRPEVTTNQPNHWAKT